MTHTTRRVVRRILLPVIAVALILVAAPAARADDETAVSRDGTTWAADITVPLFDPGFRWVPGDSESATFYVRNDGPTSARLRIEARGDDADELLARDDIQLAARAAGGAWIALENGVSSGALTDAALRRGGIVQVDVRAQFDPASPNRSQDELLPLAFVVTLSGDVADQGDNGDSGDSAPLPDTGAAVAAWQIWLAVVLIGAGLALVVRRRRDETVPDDGSHDG